MRCSRTILIRKKSGLLVRVPCGQCINCRLNRARQWSLRIMHESKKYPVNVFATLTYSDDYLPASGSLQIEDLQKFFKRFRKNRIDRKIRYFACGEYGDRTGRPHYHIAFFNVDFSDFSALRSAKGGGFQCLCVEWPYGLVHIGELTVDSANYVAGYILKKQTGKARKVYEDLGVQPPFCVMSRMPGIGHDFVEEYSEMLADKGYVVAKGFKYALPRYYKNFLEEAGFEKNSEVARKRREIELARSRKAKEQGKGYLQVLSDEEMQLEADARARASLFERNKV